jgi:hypothetical protein
VKNLRELRDEHVFALGIVCSALSAIFTRYLDLQYLDFSISDFTGGMFAGVSVVLFLFYLVSAGRKLRKKKRVKGDT